MPVVLQNIHKQKRSKKTDPRLNSLLARVTHFVVFNFLKYTLILMLFLVLSHEQTNEMSICLLSTHHTVAYLARVAGFPPKIRNSSVWRVSFVISGKHALHIPAVSRRKDASFPTHSSPGLNNLDEKFTFSYLFGFHRPTLLFFQNCCLNPLNLHYRYVTRGPMNALRKRTT